MVFSFIFTHPWTTTPLSSRNRSTTIEGELKLRELQFNGRSQAQGA
jgi:hypothetical protein